MKKGDRVSFDGRMGTVEGFMPAGMVDIRFDDASGRIERRHQDRLAPVARTNGRKGRKPRRARRNADKVRQARDLREAEAAMRRTTKAKAVRREVDVKGKLRNRGATMFTRPDPPRLSGDRRTYCGNPIDGTAYYLVIDDSKRWVPRWITKAEVKKGAADAQVKPGTQEFYDWFRTVLLGNIQAERGVEILPVKMSARKFIRLRGSKRGAAAQSKLIKDPELLMRQGKAGAPGSEPDPATDFSLDDPETGEEVYFRVSRWRSAGPEKLSRFSVYRYRRFVAPAQNVLKPALVKRWGALAAALHTASLTDRTLSPLGIHPQVCQWLIASGAVTVGQGRYGTVELDPRSKDFNGGDTIQVNLKAKDADPFFSWVPAVVPLMDKRDMAAPCLSGEDLMVRKGLKTMANVLGSFAGALGRVRGLFRRLAEQPGSLRFDQYKDVQGAVTKLARSYASLIRWYARLEQGFVEQDPVSMRVGQVFLSTVLDPGNPASVFSRAKSEFRNTPGMRGLVSGDWLTGHVVVDDPSKVAATLRREVRKLQRQGQEVQIVDEAAGAFRSRTPPEEARSSIDDERDYAEFMDGLRQRVLAMTSPGQTQAVIDIGVVGGETKQAMATLSVLPQPGKSALLFLEGKTSPLPHPMDDMLLYVQPSIQPAAYRTLVDMRQAAQGRGIDIMRRGRSRGVGSGWRSWEKMLAKEPSAGAAVRFRQLVGQYAQGGLQTPRGRVDPIDRKVAFDLQRPAGWPVPLDQQMDANWAITLVVDDVFPSLVWGMGVPPERAAKESRDLLLLANLYFMVGGYQLTGPLNPLDEPLVDPLLAVARTQVRNAEAKLLGGSSGLSSTGNYTAYKTYNPVLFELTRLFWPTRGAGDADPRWSSILAHPSEAAGIDAVGRYGYAAKATQQATTQSRSVEEVQYRLWAMTDERRMLNWPLGMGPDDADDAAQLWLDQPLEYLATLKESAQGVISKLMLTRRVGLPRAERPPAGDMPFLFDGQPAFYPGDAEKGIPGSVLHQAERSRFDQGLDAMIREIDMAIEKLDAKIGRKK